MRYFVVIYRWKSYIWVAALLLCFWIFYTLSSLNYNNEKSNKIYNTPVQFSTLRDSTNGKYKIWDMVYEETSVVNRQLDVGIATQTSLHNIHQLIGLAKSWKGPLSVAVFVAGGELEIFQQVLSLLIQCYNEYWRSTSFHVVIPLSHPPEDDVLNIKSTYTQSCDTLSDLLHGKNYDNEMSYPVNTLRNVAVYNLHSSHVMVIDVDMVPRENLHKRILQEGRLLQQSFQALVIPAFEIKSGITIPVNKEELVNAWDNHMVRPFYSKVCEKCQHQTNYSFWKKKHKKGEVGYNVSWKDIWEPFYISHKSSIQYDERFEQYGFNRISQLCHLHMMGFKFFVLHDEFLLHKGFKEPRLFHYKKDNENKYNKILYGKVKNEMLVHYPLSRRRC